MALVESSDEDWDDFDNGWEPGDVHWIMPNRNVTITYDDTETLVGGTVHITEEEWSFFASDHSTTQVE